MKLKPLLVTAASLLTVFLSAPARACDLCAIYNVMDAQSMGSAGWGLGVSEQFTHFGTMQLDGHEVDNPAGQRLDSSITQIVIGHNFTSRFGLQLTAPFIYREYRRPEEGLGIREGSTAGFGDLSLLGNYLVVRHESDHNTFTWTVTGGVKFPTGNPRRIREETQEGEGAPAAEEETEVESGIHGHDLALGSGSWDGIVGTSFFARHDRLFFTAAVQYAIRSSGAFGYRYANDLVWGGGPGFFALLNDRATVALQLNCSGEFKEKDRFRGMDSEDTGITAVYLGPEIRATWRDRVSCEIGADLPVSIDNTALQIVPDYRVRASITVRF